MARKTSGSLCGRTGSQIGSSNPSTISSISAATLGTPSSNSLGKSRPSRAATGQPWVTQCEYWYYTCCRDRQQPVEQSPRKKPRAEVRGQFGHQRSVQRGALPCTKPPSLAQ